MTPKSSSDTIRGIDVQARRASRGRIAHKSAPIHNPGEYAAACTMYMSIAALERERFVVVAAEERESERCPFVGSVPYEERNVRRRNDREGEPQPRRHAGARLGPARRRRSRKAAPSRRTARARRAPIATPSATHAQRSLRRNARAASHKRDAPDSPNTGRRASPDRTPARAASVNAKRAPPRRRAGRRAISVAQPARRASRSRRRPRSPRRTKPGFDADPSERGDRPRDAGRMVDVTERETPAPFPIVGFVAGQRDVEDRDRAHERHRGR